MRHSFVPPLNAGRTSLQQSVTCVLFCGICLMVGCGGDPALSRLDEAIPNRKTVVPVTGVVLIDGAPVRDLTVRLVNEDATAPTSADPKAVTNAEGKFKFTTYLDGDGVPPGKYRLLVEQLDRQGSGGWGNTDRLKNRFNHLSDPATTVAVAEGAPVTDLKLELQTSQKPEQGPPPYPRPITGKPIKRRS